MAAKVEVCDAWWGLEIGLNGEGNLGRANLGHPLSKSGTPVERPAPCLGQHNREVLVDVLGYPEEKIAELDARGVLK